jgi:hypothetical protein
LDIVDYNRGVRDHEDASANPWTVPVSHEAFRVLRPGG